VIGRPIEGRGVVHRHGRVVVGDDLHGDHAPDREPLSVELRKHSNDVLHQVSGDDEFAFSRRPVEADIRQPQQP